MTAEISDAIPALAQARSAAYGLIAQGFRYPDREVVDTLRDPARFSTWPEVLREFDVHTADRLGAVRACLRGETGGQSVASRVPPLGLEETFNHLFGHAVRGRCPPYELEYASGEIIQRAAELADLAGFYAAFGVEVASTAHDRADHVCVECEFMSLLCAREAYAARVGGADHLDICRDAQRAFLRDHLAGWLPGFAHRVARADPHGFYSALAGFAAALVAGECRCFDVAVGPKLTKLRSADPVLDTTISCAEGDGCSDNEPERLTQIRTDPEPVERS